MEPMKRQNFMLNK